MPKGTTQSLKKVVQAGIETLNSRMVGIATEFKDFLQGHQAVVAKQEAKREKLIGSTGPKLPNRSNTSAAASPQIKRGMTASSLQNKRSKMKILPTQSNTMRNGGLNEDNGGMFGGP